MDLPNGSRPVWISEDLKPFLTVVLKFMTPSAARMMEKELAKRWNLGVRKTPITNGSATTDLGGKLPPRPWLSSSPAARTFASVDWSVFGELLPFVSPGKWSVDEIHAFISDGAAGPDGLDSDTLHALSDESLEAVAELLDTTRIMGIGLRVGQQHVLCSYPNLRRLLLVTADP